MSNSSQKITLKISPLDTLFFRDGKPFNRGEDNWAESLVLPNPSVLWGSIFSMLWSKGIVSLKERSKLNLARLYLENQSGDFLIPAPLELFLDKRQNREVGFRREHHSLAPFPSGSANYFKKNEDLEGVVEINNDIEVEAPEGYYISLSAFLYNYSAFHRLHAIDFFEGADFSYPNSKIGIGRNDYTKTAEDGALFRVNMIEYSESVALIAEFNTNIDFPPKGLIKLGGEGKIASFEVIKQPLVSQQLDAQQIQMRTELGAQNVFKIFFMAPLIPSMSLFDLFHQDGFELIAGVAGKPVSVGGFDYEEQKPKIMRKAVPAGSVFYIYKPPEAELLPFLEELRSRLKPDSATGFNQFLISNHT